MSWEPAPNVLRLFDAIMVTVRPVPIQRVIVSPLPTAPGNRPVRHTCIAAQSGP